MHTRVVMVASVLQTLTMTVRARVRTDDAIWSYRGILASCVTRLVTQVYDRGFVSTPESLLLSLAGFQDLVVTPRVVEGVLPFDGYV